MGCPSEIHFIAVLCIFSCFYYYVAYNGLCQVVGNQLRPDFLFDEFCFIRMETAKTNGVFELTERGFDSPSGKIKAPDILCGEFIRWKVGHDAFVRAVIQLEPYDPDRDRIGIQGAVWHKTKGGCGTNKGHIIAGCRDFLGMGTPNDNVKAQVKSPFFRNGQVSSSSADIDIFGTKEEKLFFSRTCAMLL